MDKMLEKNRCNLAKLEFHTLVNIKPYMNEK